MKKLLPSNFRHSKYSQITEDVTSNYIRKSNNFQNIGTIKSCVSCTFDNHIIDDLIIIQANFIWKNAPAKIKHKTLNFDLKQYDLKCTDATVV